MKGDRSLPCVGVQQREAGLKESRSRVCAQALVEQEWAKQMREPLHLNAVPKSLLCHRTLTASGPLMPSVVGGEPHAKEPWAGDRRARQQHGLDTLEKKNVNWEFVI